MTHQIKSAWTHWGWLLTCSCGHFAASVPTMAIGTRMAEDHMADALLTDQEATK